MTTLRLVHPPVDHAAAYTESRTMHFSTPERERLVWAHLLWCMSDLNESRALVIDEAGQQWLMKPYPLGYRRRRVLIDTKAWLRRETLRSGKALSADSRSMDFCVVTTESELENATHDPAPNFGCRPRRRKVV